MKLENRLLRYRLHTMRLIVLILAITLTTLAVSCSSADQVEPTASEDASTPAPTATVEIEPTSTPAPTATPISLPSPTPLAEEVSDTESVNQYLRAYGLLGSGDYDDAQRQFNTVVQLEPGFAHGWDGIGQALLFQGEFEEAIYYLDKAIELRPTLAPAYSHRSLARLNLDDLDGALRDAKHALRLDDELVDPYIVIGRVHSAHGNGNEALSNFNKAVEISPDDGGVYWWRGRFWRDAVQDFDRALADFDKAIELDPAVASIFLDRAILRIQGGIDIDKIRADLEEAISLSLDPRLPRVIERAEELLDVIDEVEAQLEATATAS
jgi:tetratricopeptide (TPR) repeat protein